jgi:hypothetical protein
MPEPVTEDYVPEQLLQAARESRAWATVVRSSAALHVAMLPDLDAPGKRVARALSEVAEENAKHAEKMALLYEQRAAECA